jgi:hypothetical protein
MGCPARGVRATRADLVLIPLGLAFVGFAALAFLEFQGESGLATPVSALALLAFGIYLIGGRYVADTLRRAKTYYAVTTRRVLIVTGSGGRVVRTVSIDELSSRRLIRHAGALGSIEFGVRGGSVESWFGWLAQAGWPGLGSHRSPSLELIRNAESVDRLLDEVGRSDST